MECWRLRLKGGGLHAVGVVAVAVVIVVRAVPRRRHTNSFRYARTEASATLPNGI